MAKTIKGATEMTPLRKKKTSEAPVRRRLSDRTEEAMHHDEETSASPLAHQASFQKSRTLTGSASSSVRAANENRGELKSKRLKQHELRVVRRKVTSILFILILIFAAGVALSTQFIANVTGVTYTNKNIVKRPDNTIFTDAANSYFAARPLERFIFSFRANDFNAYMQATVPEVKATSVKKAGLIGGDLTVTLRQPVASWQASDKKDFVDETGAVFTKNYFAAPGVTIDDKSGAEIDGNAVTSRRFLQFVGQVISGVKKGGYKVQKITIPSGAIRYVDFRVAGHTFPIKAQIDRDSAGQAADIVASLRYLDKKNITPRYVDVRVAGKMYWK